MSPRKWVSFLNFTKGRVAFFCWSLIIYNKGKFSLLLTNLDTCCVNDWDTIVIYNKFGCFHYLFSLIKQHTSIFFISNGYRYKTKIVTSLLIYDDKIDKYRLIHRGRTSHHLPPLMIFIDKYQKISDPLQNIIRVCANVCASKNTKSEILCSYHCLPLDFHRIFVAQFANRIYFIDIKILDALTCDVDIRIFCTIIDNKYSSDNYLICFLKDENILRIIKNYGNNLKIIKELTFKDIL